MLPLCAACLRRPYGARSGWWRTGRSTSSSSNLATPRLTSASAASSTDYLDRWRALDRLNSTIFHALAENKIGIPFPQRDLHIVSSTIPFDGSREA